MTNQALRGLTMIFSLTAMAFAHAEEEGRAEWQGFAFVLENDYPRPFN